MASGDNQRIDKWLWFARVARTRTAAQQLAVSGRVRLNGDKNQLASRPVKPGDVLTIVMERGVKVLKVLQSGTRRGPASEAQGLYEDLSPPLPPSPPIAPTAARPTGSGRPTKRQRRELDRFRSAAARSDDDFSGGGE